MKQKLARPKKVGSAVSLLYLALGLGILRTIIMYPSALANTSYPILNTLLHIIFLGLALFF